VELGLEINTEIDHGEISLFFASQVGLISIVMYLVELGLDINKQTKNGNTLLFNACKNGNLDK